MGSLRWDPTGKQLLSAAAEDHVKVWIKSDDSWICRHNIEHHAPVMLAEWCQAVGKVDPPQLLCATYV